MQNFLTKIKLYVIIHKIISGVILVVILGLGFWLYSTLTSTAGVTRYVLSPVTTGTIVSSVDSSGQVSALNEVTINPTVSGALTSINVKPGDKVAAGQTLFVLDDTTAQKAVRDAEISLQNANLALQKIQLQNSSTNLKTTLANDYGNTLSAIASTFLDLPSTLTGLQNMLAQKDLSDNAARNNGTTALTYRNTAVTALGDAQTAYLKNQTDFSAINSNSTQTEIDSVLSETYKTTTLLANAIKDMNDYVNFVSQYTGQTSTYASYLNTLAGYTTTINGHLSTLLGDQTSIATDKQAFPTSDLNTQSAQIAVEQAQNTLADAKQNLSYYFIKAPFAGVIASVPVLKGSNASSGTTLGTIITSQELAVVTLNEVDVAKIALGEKATLTFSAIPDLTIAGQVVQIDSLGTVSQGVVNYNVQISFATSDPRVKPGMSVDAKIITKVAQDVLIVPSSAIKTLPAQAGQNGTSYVQMFDTALPTPATGVQGSVSSVPPRNQTVVTGISDATSTEITSGLKEGDEIVTKTISSTTKTTTSTTPSILGSTTSRGGGSGGVRIP